MSGKTPIPRIPRPKPQQRNTRPLASGQRSPNRQQRRQTGDTAFPDAPRRRRSRLLTRLGILNAIGLGALWCLETGVAERHWLTGLITYVPQWPFGIPTVLLLFGALLRREWRAFWLSAAVLALFSTTLLGMRLGLPPPPDAPGTPLRVMTYNIHHDARQIEQIAAAVQAAQPDILCLQEANAVWGRSDPMVSLRRRLPQYEIAQEGEFVIASRHRIVSSQARPLNVPGWRNRILQTDIVVPERGGKQTKVSVFNVHLHTFAHAEELRRNVRSLPSRLRASARIRDSQVRQLLQWSDAATDPVLICGDFNTPPRGLIYRRLTRIYADAFGRTGRGMGYTYPSRQPQLRIDYVFCGKGIRPRGAYVPSLRASDHRPLVADIQLSDSDEPSGVAHR